MSVFRYQVYQAERLLTSRGLPSDSLCVVKAEPGKLDIKRREPGILFISFNYLLLNTLQTSDYDVIFYSCVDSASLVTSFKKVQRHHDLIKLTCRQIGNVY